MAQSDCSQVVKDCKKVIAECDKTLQDKNKALELADLTINRCMSHGIEVQYQLNEAQSELNKFYRNPWIMGGIGVLAGIIVSQTILKR